MSARPFYLQRRFVIWAFLLVTALHLYGAIFIDLMDVDATQYACIGLEMKNSRQYLQVLHHGQDYLDKPPLLFWTSALSFSLFGVSNFSYRLFSLLFIFLGVFSTYRLARLWYSEFTSVLSALILYTTQAVFLLAHDVRTDTLLLGAVVFATWQAALCLKAPKWKHLVLFSLGSSMAMMAKGPVGLMIPLLAICGQIVYTRNWRSLFHYRWLVAIVIIVLCLSPMLAGLYAQYGGMGVKFFLWTQSFGRITGENTWRNDATHFYFLHNFLWSFLPWALVAVAAIIMHARKALITFFRPDTSFEVVTITGFLLPFIAFSFSHYKLPHYIFSMYPFAAIMTAVLIARFVEKGSLRFASGLKFFQLFVCWGMWALALALVIWVFPLKNPIRWILLVTVFGVFLFLIFRRELAAIIPAATVMTAIGCNIVMSVQFYPHLLQYQSGSRAGQWVRAQIPGLQEVYMLDEPTHSFDFYSRRIHTVVALEELRQHPEQYAGHFFYARKKDAEALRQAGMAYTVITTFPHFRVTMLSGNFLNPETRANALSSACILEIK